MAGQWQPRRHRVLPRWQPLAGLHQWWRCPARRSADRGAPASFRLAQLGSYAINVDALGDYVHASIVDAGPVPRIPPARVLGGIEAQSDRVTARAEAEHVFEQNRIAPFETPTADYTLVNASIGFKPFSGNDKISLLLSANNIFDVEARRHSSFLKDFAPLGGRDLRATIRVGF